MFTYRLDGLSEMDQMITALVDKYSLQTPRKRSVSCEPTPSSFHRTAIVPLLSTGTPTSGHKKKVNHGQVILVFIGQCILLANNSIPLLRYSAAAYPNESLLAGGLTLALPFSFALLNHYLSTVNAITSMRSVSASLVPKHIEAHAINGLPVRIKSQKTGEKKCFLLTFFQFLGSLYFPICNAFTTAQIMKSLAGSEEIQLIAFIINLFSLSLESHLNHSFWLLSHFVSRRSVGETINPNQLQDYWIRSGCWLNERRRWLNGLWNLTIIATTAAIPSYLLQSFDSWPNHLYFGGLIGIAMCSGLAQINKNYSLVQAQNQQMNHLNYIIEKIRLILFDRPEFALLWDFVSHLKISLMIVFGVFSLLLLTLPLLDQWEFSTSLTNYRVNTAIFSFGTFLFLSVFYSSLHACLAKMSAQLSFSAWESILAACSASSLLTLIANNSDFVNDSIAVKIGIFLGIYIFSSVLVTARDYALHRVQASNLFWQQPAARAQNRFQPQSDGVLYTRSRSF